MNRWLTLIPVGLAAVLAGCGSSVTSSTQPATNGGVVNYYTMEVSPPQFVLSSGDWTSITATVDLSYENGASKPISPQPTIKFYSSDPRVTVSPAGQVCAGQWDSLYLTCTASSSLPAGYVTITARDADHNVNGSTQVTVHQRAASIVLTPSAAIPSTDCISQNDQVFYTVTATDVNGNPILNCSTNPTAGGCVHTNDYIWSVSNTAVATAGEYGGVTAVAPGVTNVFANLNGTISAPVAFATCPPKAIVLSTSAYTGTTPVGPYSTSDLSDAKGQTYVTATMVDTNNNPITTAPLSFVTSDPLTGSFGTFLPLTSTLTANTSGRFTFAASCGPPTCNPTVGDFTINGTSISGASMGFGFPIYSNVIGATVPGQVGTSILVTGTVFPNGNAAHQLQVYDSESLLQTNTISLPNTPNSLVVAPNGATAYVGSSAGLMVVNLTAATAAISPYPIVGGLSTQFVTGTVLGVSQDSRYVVVSDTTLNGGTVFLIDTTGTKTATQFNIPNIDSVAFAADDSNFWIGGAGGVYIYNSDAFVPIPVNTSNSNVTSLAWMPDGQTLFASGDQLTANATCNNLTPPTRPAVTDYTSAVQGGLSTTALSGVTHLLGLNGTSGYLWFDYPFSSSSYVPVPQSVSNTSNLIQPSGAGGNVCLSTVTAGTPVTIASAVACTPTQVTYSPTLNMEFITGVNPSCTTSESLIHGFDPANPSAETTLATANPDVPLSGGILSDGRKLYFGTWDQTTQTATLHRIDLSTGTTVTSNGTLAADGTHTEDLSTTVTIVPSFVAVVPR